MKKAATTMFIDAISAEVEDMIELNQASLIQLERLPGIGFRRAQSITTYRDENGKFKHINELQNVLGIDEITFDILSAHVAIKDAPPAKTGELKLKPDPNIFAPQYQSFHPMNTTNNRWPLKIS